MTRIFFFMYDSNGRGTVILDGLHCHSLWFMTFLCGCILVYHGMIFCLDSVILHQNITKQP